MLNYSLYSLLILNSYFNHEYLSIIRNKSRFLITINLKFLKHMKIVFSQHDIFCTFKHWSNTIFRASSLPKVGPLTKTPQDSRFTRNGARLILRLVIAYDSQVDQNGKYQLAIPLEPLAALKVVGLKLFASCLARGGRLTKNT